MFRVQEVLKSLHKAKFFTCIIHGGARGTDSYAGYFARAMNIPQDIYRPRYSMYSSRIAPLMRNQEMIDKGKPQLAIEFPGGTGTADMHERVIHAGIDLIVIKDEENGLAKQKNK
jgi:hypothetical protein